MLLNHIHFTKTVVILLSCCAVSESLNCFSCKSVKNSDRSCDDPFEDKYTMYLKKNCQNSKQGEDKMQTSNYCIKVKGTTCKLK